MCNSWDPYGSSGGAWKGFSCNDIQFCMDDRGVLSTCMLGVERKWVGLYMGSLGLCRRVAPAFLMHIANMFFVGGGPVEIGSGIGGLAYSWILGRRGEKELINFRPHNVSPSQTYYRTDKISQGLTTVRFPWSLSAHSCCGSDGLDLMEGPHSEPTYGLSQPSGTP
jgi:hypothetical protein